MKTRPRPAMLSSGRISKTGRPRPPLSPRSFLRTFLLTLLLLGGCYSVEFVPSPEYPGLRYREPPPVVEVVYERPKEIVRRLGVASIRDVADPRSADFREFVIAEARRRGAPAAWIRVDQMRRVPHNTFGAWLNPGDGIGIIPVVLFSRPDH
jgi:hypothetical protein